MGLAENVDVECSGWPALLQLCQSCCQSQDTSTFPVSKNWIYSGGSILGKLGTIFWVNPLRGYFFSLLLFLFIFFQLISYATPITFLTPCLLAALIWMTSAWQDDPCIFRSVQFEVLLQCTHELKKMIVICYSKHRAPFLWVEILIFKFKNLIEQIRN